MHYISPLVKEKKKFRPVIFRGAESKMAAYMEFETGHTFDPSKSSPVYRSVVGMEELSCMVYVRTERYSLTLAYFLQQGQKGK